MSEPNIDGRSLAESSKSVAEMLRAAANPARVKVLALLSDSERSLSFLVSETKLSKNALINHLALLVNLGLVGRQARGRYALTPDGRKMVELVAGMYAGSRQRVDHERRMLRTLYASGPRSVDMMDQNRLIRPAEFMESWLSFTGAMAGCLRALGVECDPFEVGGVSGYAFLLSVAKGRTSPASPTALGAAWEDIAKGTEALGWQLEHWCNDQSYPAAPDKPTPEEVRVAKSVFDKVQAEIDRGKPVVLWGLYAPEYGVVNGYDRHSYIVSTFRHRLGMDEPPVLYYDLKASGCLDLYMFREPLELDSRAVAEEVLERAVRFATGSFRPNPGFVSGPAALTEWADVLSSGNPDITDYFGHSYTAQCWADGRRMAAEFTIRMAKRAGRRRAEELSAASKCYAREHELMRSMAEASPFVMEERSLEEKVTKRSAELLREARRHEEEAIRHLQRALRS